eukprot:2897_1
MSYETAVDPNGDVYALEEDTHDFTSQHQPIAIVNSILLPNKWFTSWRISAGVYCTVILFWSIINDGTQFPLYLTDWSVLFSTVYLLLVMTVTMQINHIEASILCFAKISINNICKYACHFQHISASISLVTVIAFWYFIHNPINCMSIHQHGISSLLTILDVFLCGNELYFITVYKPLIFSICYLILSFILGVYFNISVYVAVDWKYHPRQSFINTAICVVLLFFIHGLICMIKQWILTKHAYKTVSPEIELSKINKTDVKSDKCVALDEELIQDEMLGKADQQIYGDTG